MQNDSVAAAPEDLVLGVLGGMGPQATVDFLGKLVEATPVSREQDHLRVLVDSNAKVPDRNQAIAGTGVSPGPVLAAMAAGLQAAGADFIVIACNTAHAFEPAVRAAISVPFVSIIEEACDACERDHPGALRVGVLAAPGCLQAGLYQSALARRGRTALVPEPDMQARFNSLLYRIKQNDQPEGWRAEMQAIAETLVARGADVLIAGCTEVPLVLDAADLPRPLVDATAHLAARCVRYARRLEPLPAATAPSSSSSS